VAIVAAIPARPSKTQVSVKFQALTATIHTPRTNTAIAEGVISRLPRSPMSLAVAARRAGSPSPITFVARACA
jgi:hypothetical protein